MVVDNAPAHVQLDNLSDVKLESLAANTMALSQPLDQGIVQSVKHIYQKNLLRRMLLATESGKTYSVDMLSAIHLLAYSWQQVEPTAIQNCFARAHFTLPTQQVSPSEADATEEDIADSDCEALIAEVLERQGGGDRVLFGTFCDVDKDVETCEDLSNSDIVNSVCGKLPSTSDEGEDDNSAELENVPCPSVAKAA